MRRELLLLVVSCIAATAFANDITVSGASLSGQNVSTHTVNVTFDVGWKNSWRTTTNEANYDAAWITARYRVGTLGAWHACIFSGTGNAAGPNAILQVPLSDHKGAFIYRAESYTGIGDVSFTNNTLVWNYGANGIADNATVEIKIFATEMVYVPAGDFYLGSGGSEANAFKKGATSEPYHVVGDIPVNNGEGLSFNGKGSGVTAIPTTFPTGFNAFYIMKYEASQQEVADFLNNLTAAQVAGLNPDDTNFSGSSYPAFSPLAPERACNRIGINVFLAYADWSCLRPMSEMEFEKACRGQGISPTPNEYAWGPGTAGLVTALDNAGTASESIPASSNANANFGDSGGTLINRPVRCGTFARAANSTREKSGATFYGVMNMSDNILEYTIYSGNDAGRNVTAATNGGGELAANGAATVPTWLTTAFGNRGGSYTFYSEPYMRVSTRSLVEPSSGAGADYLKGIRLVRSAE